MRNQLKLGPVDKQIHDDERARVKRGHVFKDDAFMDE
jgi:hypothetical protein